MMGAEAMAGTYDCAKCKKTFPRKERVTTRGQMYCSVECALSDEPSPPELIRLRERVEALERALGDYGTHRPNCQMKLPVAEGRRICTCGWEAARKLLEGK